MNTLKVSQPAAIVSNAEILADFLNLPKVLGLTLAKKSQVLYFVMSPKNYNTKYQQKILNITIKMLAEVSTSFDLFEASIDEYFTYIYDLGSDHSVCVITQCDNLMVKSIAGRQLQKTLQKDLDVAKANFRVIQRQQNQQDTVNMSAAATSIAKLTTDVASPQPHLTFSEVNSALNSLSQTVCDFLGPKLTVNFWMTSKPNYGWLQQFQVTDAASLKFSGDGQSTVSAVQHLCIREWTRNFMDQCSHIVHDLPTHIEKSGMSSRERKALSIRTLKTEDINSSNNESLFDF